MWRLIERADEYVKYAQARDPAEAYTRARAVLDEAESALALLPDERAAAALRAQVARRREDLTRLEDAR